MTESASKVYFNNCADKRNIIFNNMCWQMIRTAETGGIKMIYNGEPENGQCLSTRGNHKGIVQSNHTSQTLNSEYLYGNSFSYDTRNNSFNIYGSELVTWNDSTYKKLIGKFTCKSTTGSCTTLYQINGYISNTQAYASAYTLANTNYASIGTTSYSSNYYSPAMVGYMFNKVYNYKVKLNSEIALPYMFGSSFTYSNGTYTLSGTTQNITDWSTGYNSINNTHYICWNTTGTCSNLSYVFFTSYINYEDFTEQQVYYIDIIDGKSITDIVNEMLYDDDVNTYNSSIKGIIDSWFKYNISPTNLENAVFCNSRNMYNETDNGWNPNGGDTTSFMNFKSYIRNGDLSCNKITDQFSTFNNLARLKHPVALLEDEERYNLSSNSLLATGVIWWEISGYYFGSP